MDKKARLKKVADGLQYVYIALVTTVLLAIGGGFIGGSVAASERAGNASNLSGIVQILGSTGTCSLT